jgi:hypothetical protein
LNERVGGNTWGRRDGGGVWGDHRGGDDRFGWAGDRVFYPPAPPPYYEPASPVYGDPVYPLFPPPSVPGGQCAGVLQCVRAAPPRLAASDAVTSSARVRVSSCRPPFSPPSPPPAPRAPPAGSRALLRWFGSPLCNTQGGINNAPPSLVLVTPGVCNSNGGGGSYQVLCRADRASGVIRFCQSPSCGGGCSEVAFANGMCLINLPGYGARSYDASCAPVGGPWWTPLGVVQDANDALLGGVSTPIAVTPAPLYYRRRRRLHEAGVAPADDAPAAAAAPAAAGTAAGVDVDLDDESQLSAQLEPEDAGVSVPAAPAAAAL